MSEITIRIKVVASISFNLILSFRENSKLTVRRVNDKLMQLERHFIDPRGLPNREDYK